MQNNTQSNKKLYNCKEVECPHENVNNLKFEELTLYAITQKIKCKCQYKTVIAKLEKLIVEYQNVIIMLNSELTKITNLMHALNANGKQNLWKEEMVLGEDLTNLNLDELTHDEIIQKIVNNNQYKIVIKQLSNTFLVRSEDMHIFDKKIRNVMGLFKSFIDYFEREEYESVEDDEEYEEEKQSTENLENFNIEVSI